MIRQCSLPWRVVLTYFSAMMTDKSDPLLQMSVYDLIEASLDQAHAPKERARDGCY
jgi:hypothetical protein